MKIGKQIKFQLSDLIYDPVSSEVYDKSLDDVFLRYINDEVWSNLSRLIYWTIYNPIAISIKYREDENR
jgi:hypothetical protein